ncbi:hypothetical protein GECvBGOT_gp189 [Salmonella phage GEC_vB_GOT]|nr:hypothetical protein GECvBGOT_gp189 [Salmonella phage GEC_vB_GOT]
MCNSNFKPSFRRLATNNVLNFSTCLSVGYF